MGTCGPTFDCFPVPCLYHPCRAGVDVFSAGKQYWSSGKRSILLEDASFLAKHLDPIGTPVSPPGIGKYLVALFFGNVISAHPLHQAHYLGQRICFCCPSPRYPLLYQTLVFVQLPRP